MGRPTADALRVEVDRIAEAADRIEKVVFDGRASGGTCPEALAHLTSYASLLRTNLSHPTVRCMLKLELADGRWDLAEHELPGTPSVGDEIVLDDRSTWRVSATELVLRSRGPQAPHRLFVCSLAA